MKFLQLIVMSVFLIVFTSQEYLNNFILNNEYNIRNSSNYSEYFNFQKILESILDFILKESENHNNNSHYIECINNMNQTYKKKETNQIQGIEKIYEGSSKGFIDLSGFYNCIDLYELYNNSEHLFNFYTIYPKLSNEEKKKVNKFDSTSMRDNLWIFGFCLKRNLCEKEGLEELFRVINSKFNNTFNLTDKNISIIDNLQKYEEIKKIDLSKNSFLKLLPIILIIIQILFIIIKTIPVKIFGICIKRKYRREINPKKIGSLLNNISFSQKINLKIRECFSFFDNLSELINDKKENELFKDQDLTYIKGVKGLGLIFFIFGTTFIYFFNYPICISGRIEKINYMKSKITSLLIIFWRTTPAILLSSSGYSLSYKLLNFLDKKLANTYINTFGLQQINSDNDEDDDEKTNILENQENNNDIDSQGRKLNNVSNPKYNSIDFCNNSNSKSDKSVDKDESKSYIENTYGIKFYQNALPQIALNKKFKNQAVNEAKILSKISTTKIRCSTFFNFIFRQFHKLFCLNIGILYFKFFYPIMLVRNNPGAPLMNYLLEEIIEKIDYGFGNLLIYKNFIELFSAQEKNDEKYCALQLFSIIICECNYFFIGSLFIFICYKRKYALDQIIFVLIFLFLIFKVMFILLKKLNPGLFYFDSDYQRLFFNPIFNFDYYLIGMLFGIVNYVLQNEIAKKQSIIKERPLVNIPTFLSRISDYNKSRNIIYFILSIIFLITFLLIFPILFIIFFEQIIEEDKNEEKKLPTLFIIISSIDVDCFIYLFHFFMISCYISGRNMFFKFFNSRIWSQLSKLYFWIIIFTPLVNYFIIYKTETQLNLSFFIVFIYGAICGVSLYIISLMFCILLELPYKRLIKLYFNVSNILVKAGEEDDDEDGINNTKYPLQKDSQLTELNEKDDENEDDEEDE